MFYDYIIGKINVHYFKYTYMYTNKNNKNYILNIYQRALYYVNSTVFLPFVRISKDNYFISVIYMYVYILYYFLDYETTQKNEGKGSHDLIVSKNNTKNFVIINVIFSGIDTIFFWRGFQRNS